MAVHPHHSVLFHEIMDCFHQHALKFFIDGTLGAGGHAEGLLLAHPEIERYFAFEQDPHALAIAEKRLAPWKHKIKYMRMNSIHMRSALKEMKVEQVDGILFDLGVSSMQLDVPERGFSFMRDGPLDMRMDPTYPLTAATIINDWTEEDIGRIFRDFGEEKFWRRAAKQVVTARLEKEIMTTFQLVEVLKPIFPWKKKGVNPLTQIFQALRICVNRELEVVETVVPTAIDLLNTHGRLAVISFHSLEDRIVKTVMREAASDKVSTSGIGGIFLNKEPLVNLVTRKPMMPKDQEIESNPRSRSAKLRVIEKR